MLALRTYNPRPVGIRRHPPVTTVHAGLGGLRVEKLDMKYVPLARYALSPDDIPGFQTARRQV